MSFGTKLFIFVFSVLLLELVPLEMILRSRRNDLATGQMIRLFVLIALVTCAVSGVATYRHFRTARSAHPCNDCECLIFYSYHILLFIWSDPIH
jgi:hypothetical protein